MPFIKISGLTTATAVSATNQFEINQNGGSRSATVAQVAAFARTSATDPVVLPAGTVSAPALTFTGDTNTGIYSPAADTIAFSEGGVEAMRLDASGNVGIGTASPTATLDVNGNVAITGTARRITGDFSNATQASRVLFQTSTAGSTTALGAIPSAGGVASTFNAFSSSDPNNASFFQFRIGTDQGDARLNSSITGTGTYLPMAFHTGGSERMRIDASGNVGIGTSSPSTRLSVQTGATQDAVRWTDNINSTGLLSTIAGASTIYTTTALAFGTGSGSFAERMRIDASGNVGIGTSSPVYRLQVNSPSSAGFAALLSSAQTGTTVRSNPVFRIQSEASGRDVFMQFSDNIANATEIGMLSGNMYFCTGAVERARITSGGDFLVGKTASSGATAGVQLEPSGLTTLVRSGGVVLQVNRLASDGNLVDFYQDTVLEGNISVAGTTVSYNGGHLARWSQLPTKQRAPALLKGTVLSNLDEMCEWLDAEGNPLPNEQLNRVKISDVEGDPNVAGVFVNWDDNDQANPYDMNIAMTGDMIIRIAAGIVVQKGMLLMSAGDGTAKPQGDDIVRSKTIAKVTSNHVTCTYPDGSYCVPCVLMAC